MSSNWAAVIFYKNHISVELSEKQDIMLQEYKIWWSKSVQATFTPLTEVEILLQFSLN